MHSSSLRRLGTKTQVLTAGFDDFVRTRLTHSLEVAQVGRDLAKQLGCSADIVDAACLAHDLGHPPFGHNGETALQEVAKNIGGFEGNAQSFRILTRLEPKLYSEDGVSAGLNLTRATLDAVIKYPWTKTEADARGTAKFNAYDSDLPVYEWVKLGRGEKCLEAQIMDLADDISYSVHDIEDALVSGAFAGDSLGILRERAAFNLVAETSESFYGADFSAAELQAARDSLSSTGLLDFTYDGTHRCAAFLKNLTSRLIGRFCSAAVGATRDEFGDGDLLRYGASICLPRSAEAEIHLLKCFAAAFVMIPLSEKSYHNSEQLMIYDLAEYYLKTGNLTPLFLDAFETAATNSGKLRVVVDQIACLTDHSARQRAQSALM